MYPTQIIVTQELSPDDSLYLKCLTEHLTDKENINRLVQDFSDHQNDEIYNNYMNQLTHANNKKGDSPMVCEGILNLCGTSSKEIEANTMIKAKALYEPIIQKMSADYNSLNKENRSLADEITKLKKLLQQHNVSY